MKKMTILFLTSIVFLNLLKAQPPVIIYTPDNEAVNAFIFTEHSLEDRKKEILLISYHIQKQHNSQLMMGVARVTDSIAMVLCGT